MVYDNAADRATVSVSSAAGSLGAANLLTDTKSEVWRSTSTSATLTINFDEQEIVGVVALAFCSLTSTSTIRVRGYELAGDASPAFDTGSVLACAYAPLALWDWGTEALGVNAYSYGGGTYGVVWFEQMAVEKLVVDIADTANPLGYVEASRLITGSYWSPENNCEYGATVNYADMSKHERTEAGDLRTERGARYKQISINLTFMPAADRARLWDIVRGNGISKPIFFSLTPESDDPVEEQTFQLYGKLSKAAATSYQFINQFSAPLELEEV